MGDFDKAEKSLRPKEKIIKTGRFFSFSTPQSHSLTKCSTQTRTKIKQGEQHA